MGTRPANSRTKISAPCTKASSLVLALAACASSIEQVIDWGLLQQAQAAYLPVVCVWWISAEHRMRARAPGATRSAGDDTD